MWNVCHLSMCLQFSPNSSTSVPAFYKQRKTWIATSLCSNSSQGKYLSTSAASTAYYLVIYGKMNDFGFYGMGKNFSYLTMLIVKICDILPKQKNGAPNFLYAAKYMKMYQKIIKKLWKCWGKNWSFLPWTQNLIGLLWPSFWPQLQNFCGW